MFLFSREYWSYQISTVVLYFHPRCVLAGALAKPVWTKDEWTKWVQETQKLPLKRARKQEADLVAAHVSKKPAIHKPKKRTPFTLERVKAISRTGVTKQRPAAR